MLLTDLPLFAAQPEPARLHRGTDRATSIAAAEAVSKTLSGRQQMVFDAFVAAGANGLTDGELETQHQFSQWAPSTARKRRCELCAMDKLVEAGRRNGMTVWRLA